MAPETRAAAIIDRTGVWTRRHGSARGADLSWSDAAPDER